VAGQCAVVHAVEFGKQVDGEDGANVAHRNPEGLRSELMADLIGHFGAG
jgi:hypothetical protein